MYCDPDHNFAGGALSACLSRSLPSATSARAGTSTTNRSTASHDHFFLLSLSTNVPVFLFARKVADSEIKIKERENPAAPFFLMIEAPDPIESRNDVSTGSSRVV